MRLIKRIFLALKTFDRPATLREIKRESGLSKDDVHKGLKGLARRSMIIADVLPRRGGTYRLVPGATMPEDMRGRYVRDLRHLAIAQPNLRRPSQRAPTSLRMCRSGCFRRLHRRRRATPPARLDLWSKA
jgi:DNA-binding IclR family transcriptional regulator